MRFGRDRELGIDQAAYIRRLVRMDIRKQRKNLARFRIRDGQDEEEFTSFMDHMMGNLRFAEEAYRALGGDPDSITEVTDR